MIDKLRVKFPPLAYLLFILITVIYVFLAPICFLGSVIESIFQALINAYGWLKHRIKHDFRACFSLRGFDEIEKQLRKEVIYFVKGKKK